MLKRSSVTEDKERLYEFRSHVPQREPEATLLACQPHERGIPLCENKFKVMLIKVIILLILLQRAARLLVDHRRCDAVVQNAIREGVPACDIVLGLAVNIH